MAYDTPTTEAAGTAPRHLSDGAAAPSPSGLTVYFDGACPVCSREIAGYRRQRGAEACTWVDAAQCDDDAFGPGLGRDAALARMTVRRADGTLVRGAGAFAEMWLALPGLRWAGRVAAWRPVTALLDLAYGAFLRLRPLWRPAAAPWPQAQLSDLRSDHAGELGAVQIYRGVLAVTRDAALREFAQHHLQTEQQHLERIEALLPPKQRSRLLPAWRVAGWLTGALPALAGPRAVYATIAAVETFVDRHYAEQIERLDVLIEAPAATGSTADGPMHERFVTLRAELRACQEDELRHRDESLAAGPATGALVRLWTACVGRGSAAAVALARRV